MIEVKNLTKIYRSGKNEVLALNSLSFTLPEKGLIFVTGKSGSGKSTLLNLIATLDDATSGEIKFNNLILTSEDEHNLNVYRKKFLGIIYQNYNLFENETVLENAKIGLADNETKENAFEIKSLLTDLEIDDIEKKKVKNLSGGQKQRVAIARALIKNPKCILADEPTGNLDTETAKAIFSLFKKFAKDKLVVVVTHDIKSALEYGDRIISLSDGMIVNDVERNNNYSGEIDDSFIYISPNSKISEAEIDLLNNDQLFLKKKLKKSESEFVETKPIRSHESEQLKLTETKPKFNSIFHLAKRIAKRSRFSLIFTSIITVLLITLMSLSSSFISFKGKKAAKEIASMYETNVYIARKGFSKTGRIEDIEKQHVIEAYDSDLDILKKKNYSGNIYKIYCTPISTDDKTFLEGNSEYKYNSDHFYWESGCGVIQADEALLKKQFGNNYQVVSGSIENTLHNHKLIITDYLADAILYYKPSLYTGDPNKPYDKITSIDFNIRYSVGAVIKTDYKEKHKEIYEYHLKDNNKEMSIDDIHKALAKSDAYQKFIVDVDSRLNFGYTINPNYLSDYFAQKTSHAYLANSYVSFGKENTPSQYHHLVAQHIYADESLKDNEIMLHIDDYNALFGKNIKNPDDPKFEVKTVYLYNFGFDQDVYTSIPKHSKELVIKKVYKDIDTPYKPLLYCSDKFLLEAQSYYQFTYEYMFDDVSNIYTIIDTLGSEFYYPAQNTFETILTVAKVTKIFSDIFKSVLIGLFAVEFLIILFYGIKLMKKENYSMGVYRSLGYSNKHLNLAMVMANILTILIFLIGSLIASVFMSLLANRLVQDGFVSYLHNAVYYDLTLVSFNPIYVFMYTGFIAVFISLTLLISLLKIRKIKPNHILQKVV